MKAQRMEKPQQKYAEGLIRWAIDCYNDKKNPAWMYIATLVVRDNYPNIDQDTLDHFNHSLKQTQIDYENAISDTVQQ